MLFRFRFFFFIRQPPFIMLTRINLLLLDTVHLKTEALFIIVGVDRAQNSINRIH